MSMGVRWRTPRARRGLRMRLCLARPWVDFRGIGGRREVGSGRKCGPLIRLPSLRQGQGERGAGGSRTAPTGNWDAPHHPWMPACAGTTMGGSGKRLLLGQWLEILRFAQNDGVGDGFPPRLLGGRLESGMTGGGHGSPPSQSSPVKGGRGFARRV